MLNRSFQVGDVGGDFKPIGSPIMSDDVQISGTFAEYMNQLPSSSDPDKPGIKELLAQLQEAIEKEPSLDDKGKKKALKQLQTLAEAATNSNDEGMKELAEDATTMLKGIIAALQPTAALVTICEKLLPAIASFFGL